MNQWINYKTNRFFVYIISDNKIIERTGSWTGFWKKDFNVLDDPEVKYLPEDVTQIIDSRGMDSIRKIDIKSAYQLSGEERSALAFYVALQYIRTPKHRKEADTMYDKFIKENMRRDISSLDDVGLTKEDALKEVPRNDRDVECLNKIKQMTNEEFKYDVFAAVHSDEIKISLTREGHSKEILKIEGMAKKMFDCQWTFYVAPKDTAFITSDNPCFVGVHNKFSQGPCNSSSITYFPLSPSVCICINAGNKLRKESYEKITKRIVRGINKKIIENSFESFVVKDKMHLDSLLKSYDHKKHKKNKEAHLYESDEYLVLNLE